MTPQQYCQDKAARSGSSFTVAFRFLPAARRDAMTALYAFCREVDDVVDEVHDDAVARAKLAWWREEIGRLYAGDPQHPVTRALQPHVAAFDLPQGLFEEIIDGMQMDLDVPRYPRFADLSLYCHRVAGVVGQLSAQVFGYRDRATLKYAHELGLALQLTNIIRDVGEDARRGRLYLPIEDLERFGVPAADIFAYRESDAFAALMDFQVERAREHYRRAWALLPAGDRKAQAPGLMMAAIYRTLLEEVAKEGAGKVLNQHLRLGTARKGLIALSTWAFGYRP